MAVGFVAVHYPHPDHHDDFVRRVERAVEVMLQTPGCLAADGWVTPTGDAVISIGKWESPEAQAASVAMAEAADVDFVYDEREVRPRMILRLVSPPAAAGAG
jgi:quinol monooxygenase YgiN